MAGGMSLYPVALTVLLVAGAGALFEAIVGILYVIEVAQFSLQAKTIIEGVFMGVGVIDGLIFVGVLMNQMSNNRNTTSSKDLKNIYSVGFVASVLFFGFGLLFLGRVWWLYNTDYVPTDDLMTFIGYPLPESPTNVELTNRIVVGLEDAIAFGLAILLLYCVTVCFKCLHNPEHPGKVAYTRQMK